MGPPPKTTPTGRKGLKELICHHCPLKPALTKKTTNKTAGVLAMKQAMHPARRWEPKLEKGCFGFNPLQVEVKLDPVSNQPNPSFLEEKNLI